MTICWDVAVLTQRIYYGAKPPYEVALEEREAYEEHEGLNRERTEEV